MPDSHATGSSAAKARAEIQAERDRWANGDHVLNSNGINYLAGLDFALERLKDDPSPIRSLLKAGQEMAGLSDERVDELAEWIGEPDA